MIKSLATVTNSLLLGINFLTAKSGKIKEGKMSKFKMLIIPILLSVFLMTGCQSLKEKFKGFLGISTKELEAERKSAIIKTFDYGYFAAFTKTLDALKEMSAYIYAQNIKKHMIAIYVSESDTTPVGIFFKEINAASTQIEVSSPGIFTKEAISQKLFKALSEKSQTAEEKKGETNEKK